MAVELRNADLLRDVRTLFRFGVVRYASDRELLERFLTADHVEAEAAFTILVERHGPMVLNVCRHVLADSHDAHDAFQATFLVLLRRARSIRNRDSLASWLFGVAMRVARRARYAAVVRRFHEQRAGDRTSARSLASNGHSECLTAMHEEIARLPERYREPIVLCHLEGLSTAAAAQQLGCAHGTILSRLARGRQRLRTRLTHRGQSDPEGVPAVPVPAAVVNSTVQTALNALAFRTSLAAIVTPAVAALTPVTLRILFMPRIALVAALLTTTSVITAVAIPLVGPLLPARSQTSSSDSGPHEDQVAAQANERTLVFPRDLEETFYKILERDHVFNNPDWPFVIKVRDVVGKSLVDATFKHRAKGKPDEYDAVIQSKRAVLRFDLEAKIIRIFLEQSEVQHFDRDADVMLINNDILEFPIPVTNLHIAEQIQREAGKQPGPAPATQARSGLPMTLSGSQIERMHSDQALSLAQTSDGKTLVSGGLDGAIRLWDMVVAKEVAKLAAANSIIRSVSFSPDDKTLACAGDDGLIRLWDVPTKTLKMTLPGLSEAMCKAARVVNLDAVSFAPGGQSLAVAGGAGINPEVPEAIYEVRVLDVHTGQATWAHMGRGDRTFSLAFAPDGTILASAGGKAITLWHARTGEPARALSPGLGDIFFTVAFTTDAKSVIGGGRLSFHGNHPAGQVTIWDVATGTIRQFIESDRGMVQSIAIAPDGKTIASGGDGPWRLFQNENRRVGAISLWDMSTGKLLWTVDGEGGTVRSMAFSPDGKSLCYCDNCVVGVIDAATGKTVRTLARSTLKPLQ
jgi:RNA polymerase sigma factor (sigma-70 family)